MTTEYTPGPWEWEEANHTGVYETSSPRTLVSSSTRHYRLRDGKDLGQKPVLIPLASTTAQVAGVIDAISLEIHGTKADEALIAAAPDLLEVAIGLHDLNRDNGPNLTGPVWRDLVAALAGKADAAIDKAKVAP